MSLLLSRADTRFTPKKCSIAPFLWVNAKTGVSLSGSSITGINDLSGNGYNLAPFNTDPTYSATGMNSLFPTMTFNGTNDNLGKIGIGGVTRTKFSFFMVVTPLANIQYHTMWWAPTNNWVGSTNDTYFEDGGTGGQAVDYWVSGVAAKAPTSASTFKNNVTYDVVGTYDGTTLKIYIDGLLAGSQAFASSQIGDRITLGGLQPSTAGYGWNGKLSEFAMYPDALTAADIANLHKYAQFNWFQPWSLNTGSLIFDGATTAVDLGTNKWSYDYNSNFTIAAWICPDSGSGTKTSILGCEQGSGAFRGLDFLRESGKLSLYFANTWPTNVLYAFSNSDAVPANNTTWTHVAVSYNGSVGSNAAHTKFYINGVQQTTTSSQDSLSATVLDASLNTYIGDAWHTSFQQGKMQNVAIFSAALGQSDITTLYNNGLPFDWSTQPNIAHYWYLGFGGDTASACTDRVGSWNGTTVGTGALSPAVPLPLS